MEETVLNEAEERKEIMPFQFTIKPIPLALLIYWCGWFDIKHHFFGKKATVGYFLMTIGVWIVLSRLIHIRNKRCEQTVNMYQYSEKERYIAALGLILIPSYTLFHWWFYQGI